MVWSHGSVPAFPTITASVDYILCHRKYLSTIEHGWNNCNTKQTKPLVKTASLISTKNIIFGVRAQKHFRILSRKYSPFTSKNVFPCSQNASMKLCGKCVQCLWCFSLLPGTYFLSLALLSCTSSRGYTWFSSLSIHPHTATPMR